MLPVGVPAREPEPSLKHLGGQTSLMGKGVLAVRQDLRAYTLIPVLFRQGKQGLPLLLICWLGLRGLGALGPPLFCPVQIHCFSAPFL